MTDFTKIIDKAKELEAKMKESQEKIKNIRVEGISGSNSVKVILDGEGEMQNIEILLTFHCFFDRTLDESKSEHVFNTQFVGIGPTENFLRRLEKKV